MRILAIGDPHGNIGKIKKIPMKNLDLILLTGDLGKSDLIRKMVFDNITRKEKGLDKIEYSAQEEKRAFMEPYNSTIGIIKYLSRFAPVFIIYGNVESTNAETRRYSKEIGLKLPFLTNNLKKIKGVSIINNQLRNVKNVRIGGLQYFIDVGWVQRFKPDDYSERIKDARRESKKAREVLRRFSNLDILVCHQPPYKILDKVKSKYAPKHWKGKNAGSKIILDYIKNKKPRYVFCGHIHEGEGMKKIGRTEVYNLGICGWKIVEMGFASKLLPDQIKIT